MAGSGSDPSPAARAPIVVTGADGFIGRALVAHLRERGWPVREAVRTVLKGTGRAAAIALVGELEAADDAALDALVTGASAVVHLAGRAHVLDDTATNPEASYHSANVLATARLVQAVVRAGVPRFVFASSVKVHGESSPPDRALRPGDLPAPADAYARSKLAAEIALQSAATGRSTAVLILRLPLVYGPGVRANFLALLDAVARGHWLPLGSLTSRRSLLFTGNLASAIEAAIASDRPVSGTHLLADPQAPSVTDLARGLADALGVPARLLPVPPGVLRVLGAMAGRRSAVARLTGTLTVDDTSFREAADWSPPFSLADGLAATALWWRTRHAI